MSALNGTSLAFVPGQVSSKELGDRSLVIRTMQSIPAWILTLVGLLVAVSIIASGSPAAPAIGKAKKAVQPDAQTPISNAKSSRRGVSPKISRPVAVQGDAALPRRSAPDAAAGSKESMPPGIAGANGEPGSPARSQDASTIPWTIEEVAEARAHCIALLAPIVADVVPASPVKQGDCGAPSPVLLKSLGRTTTVELRPPITLNCATVAALYDWLEHTVQPAAQSQLDTSIVRLTGTGGYQCRNRVGAGEVKISDHAAGNAIDITAFVTRDNHTIDVETQWAHDNAGASRANSTSPGSTTAAQPRMPAQKGKGPDPVRAQRLEQKSAPAPVMAQPVSPEAAFLRRLHAGACQRFTTVLGPDANAEHRNHFHLDLAIRRNQSHYCR